MPTRVCKLHTISQKCQSHKRQRYFGRRPNCSKPLNSILCIGEVGISDDIGPCPSKGRGKKDYPCNGKLNIRYKGSNRRFCFKTRPRNLKRLLKSLRTVKKRNRYKFYRRSRTQLSSRQVT